MAVPPAAAAVASTFDVMAVMVTFLLLRRCIRSAETVATCADVDAYLDQAMRAVSAGPEFQHRKSVAKLIAREPL